MLPKTCVGLIRTPAAFRKTWGCLLPFPSSLRGLPAAATASASSSPPDRSPPGWVLQYRAGATFDVPFSLWNAMSHSSNPHHIWEASLQTFRSGCQGSRVCFWKAPVWSFLFLKCFFWSKCKGTFLVVVSCWVGLRFYCFVGFEVFFLLETVNSSWAPWICFPKFSLDAHCILHIFQTSKLSFWAYVWDPSRKRCAYSQQNPTLCPLQTQGVKPDQQNTQRPKSAVIYPIWLLELIVSNPCARLRTDGYFLSKEPPWRMGPVLDLLQTPQTCTFPRSDTNATTVSSTVWGGFQQNSGCRDVVCFNPALRTDPANAASAPHPARSPEPRSRHGRGRDLTLKRLAVGLVFPTLTFPPPSLES